MTTTFAGDSLQFLRAQLWKAALDFSVIAHDDSFLRALCYGQFQGLRLAVWELDREQMPDLDW